MAKTEKLVTMLGGICTDSNHGILTKRLSSPMTTSAATSARPSSYHAGIGQQKHGADTETTDMSKSHVDLGLRWTGADYFVDAEVNRNYPAPRTQSTSLHDLSSPSSHTASRDSIDHRFAGAPEVPPIPAHYSLDTITSGDGSYSHRSSIDHNAGATGSMDVSRRGSDKTRKSVDYGAGGSGGEVVGVVEYGSLLRAKTMGAHQRGGGGVHSQDSLEKRGKKGDRSDGEGRQENVAARLAMLKNAKMKKSADGIGVGASMGSGTGSRHFGNELKGVAVAVKSPLVVGEMLFESSSGSLPMNNVGASTDRNIRRMISAGTEEELDNRVAPLGIPAISGRLSSNNRRSEVEQPQTVSFTPSAHIAINVENADRVSEKMDFQQDDSPTKTDLRFRAVYQTYLVCFLLPAFDNKGRKLELDQFEEEDFESIQFGINGLHPKSYFNTGWDFIITILKLKHKLEQMAGMGISKVIPIAVLIFYYIHFNACTIYLAGSYYDFVGWKSLWPEFEGATLGQLYSWTYFQAVGNMFPMSFKPQTMTEQVIATLFIIVGASIYAAFLGSISSAAMSLNPSGRLYNQKMEELLDYVEWKKLDEETKDKLISYYEIKYRGKYFEEDSLLSDMNESLRADISLHNTRFLIEKVPFLRREENDGRDEIFFYRLATVLHAHYFIPGDYVTKQGDSGHDMYFILSGKVNVFINGVKVVSLYDGAYIGEVALITRVLRTATVQAAMPTVMYRLTHKDFHVVISDFPDMKLRVQKLAMEGQKMVKEAEQNRSNFAKPTARK
ncbi:anaphase-promoting complex subunit Hcn1 [Rhizoclosmatium sp. JEL0117]|nr:anaphase-promoting complex subunit Hcn1 [Rhizoclosmatium sp. JEL0117]